MNSIITLRAVRRQANLFFPAESGKKRAVQMVKMKQFEQDSVKRKSLPSLRLSRLCGGSVFPFWLRLRRPASLWLSGRFVLVAALRFSDFEFPAPPGGTWLVREQLDQWVLRCRKSQARAWAQ